MRALERPELDKLVAESIEAVKRMSPEERARMHRKQRASWVRGEIGMGSDADEAAYSRALAEDDQATLARLEAAAKERVIQNE